MLSAFRNDSGHGTFEEDAAIYSNIVGVVQKTNQYSFLRVSGAVTVYVDLLQ